MRSKRRKVETLAKLKRDLWKVLSPYIRLKSCLETTGSSEECICINCGGRFLYKEIQAGHFLPAGKYSSLRYNELNIWGECQGCNGYDKFKLRYESNLKKKLGDAAVEGMKLHAELNPVKQWKSNEIRDLIAEYSMKLDLLRASNLTNGGV